MFRKPEKRTKGWNQFNIYFFYSNNITYGRETACFFFISAVYTTEEVRAKITDSLSIGLPGVPIAAVGPIVDVDVHAESAVKFLTANNVVVADLLVAQDQNVAGRFENAANVGGLCVNRTVLVRDFG